MNHLLWKLGSPDRRLCRQSAWLTSYRSGKSGPKGFCRCLYLPGHLVSILESRVGAFFCAMKLNEQGLDRRTAGECEANRCTITDSRSSFGGAELRKKQGSRQAKKFVWSGQGKKEGRLRGGTLENAAMSRNLAPSCRCLAMNSRAKRLLWGFVALLRCLHLQRGCCWCIRAQIAVFRGTGHTRCKKGENEREREREKRGRIIESLP